MKVAILTPALFQQVKEYHGADRVIFGGAERYLVELVRLLEDLGHEVNVFQGVQIPPNAPAQLLKKEFMGMKVQCLPMTGVNWAYSTSEELSQMFNEMGGFSDLRIYFTTFLAWPHIVRPAITISHGIFWDTPQGEYRQLNADGRQEWLRRNIYGFTAPDVCVAVDSNVRKVIQAMEPGAESRIHVIPNFVDTQVFTPRATQKDWEGTRILFPRRLTTVRGVNDFVRATRDYPMYHYQACGQADAVALEEMAKSKTTGHVEWIWRPMEQMPDVYRETDIAVVPTRASEGLSLSLLEAMACGLPIVTTPVGGIGDAVIQGYNALIYDPNHDNLGACIHQLAQDKDLCRKFGERNREIAQCFDISVWRQRWTNLLGAFS